MRVAIIFHRLVPARGGAETWTAQFITWLANAGYQVELITSAQPTEPAPPVANSTVLPLRNRIEFAHAAADYVNHCHADVVHDMGFSYNSDLFHPHMGSQLALEIAKTACHRGLRRVTDQLIRAVSVRQRRLSHLCRLQYAQARSRYLAVSAKVAHDMHRYHGIPFAQIDTVHNGVDIERFHPRVRRLWRDQSRHELSIHPDDVAVLTVAHNHVLKGVSTLLEVVRRRQPSSQRIHLLVVGGHRQHPRMLMRNGCPITYAGATERVGHFYAAADVFVLPTFYDACSLTLLEAMACGLPVITTECNGASELVQHGVSGFVYTQPRDLDALSECLDACLDRGTRLLLGRAAREAAEHFSLERNFAAIADIYHRLHGQQRDAA